MLSSFYFIYVNICLKHNESNSHIESVVIAYIEHLTKEENLHGNSYHVVDMNMVCWYEIWLKYVLFLLARPT